MSDDLIAAYDALAAGGTITRDAEQAGAARRLQRLADLLADYRQPRGGLFLRLLHGNGREPPKGLYLHGGVGRGKTMLMDLFFRTVAYEPKRRLHFEAFMTETHAAIEAARQTHEGDPIPAAARAIAAPGLLLCLDEFQVNDIADAMILARLFVALFGNGTILVATSNTAPDDLYRDGLQRALFLPFITQLKQRTEPFHLKGSSDWRLSKLMGRRLFFSPLDDRARAGLEDAWRLLTVSAAGARRMLDVKGHKLPIARAAAGTAWCSFADLCDQPLGTNDYQALASTFHTLILEGIPVLGPEQRNAARRLITLIDTLYDKRICLIASAAAEPAALYTAGDGSEAFGRTASRLVEMGSRDYLEASREPIRSH